MFDMLTYQNFCIDIIHIILEILFEIKQFRHKIPSVTFKKRLIKGWFRNHLLKFGEDICFHNQMLFSLVIFFFSHSALFLVVKNKAEINNLGT